MGSHRRFIYGLIAAVAVLVPASAQAAFPGTNGKIAFSTSRDGNSEIYTMNPDGTNQTNLTNRTDIDDEPAWSPDGGKIAFESAPTGDDFPQIWTMNADGSTPTQITDPPGDNREPAWSPDGTKIAFQSNRNGSYPEIFIMNADGTNQANITNDPNINDESPAWSPDGKKIAFRCHFNICTMNIDGTNRTQLTTTTGGAIDQHPAWSPDGTKIAFDSNRQVGPFEIYAMNADGTNLTRLTNNSSTDAFPAWSPDGSQIAFQTDRDGHFQIYTMNADGTNQTRISNNSVDDFDPDWQPIPTGYPRPRGASPLLVALVVAYKACSPTAANSNHNGGVPAPSCTGTAFGGQESNFLTVGTPDSNGLPDSTIGSVRYTTIVGDPSTPQNEADVRIQVSITGVLNKALIPYNGEVQADQTVRITDKNNTGGAGGTVSDVTFPVTIPCGSGTCATTTTANTVVPGSVVEGKRANWEFGGVKVFDGGLDGLAATTADNTLFMDEGFFVP
jgi:Tol biopolymer transport system component